MVSEELLTGECDGLSKQASGPNPRMIRNLAGSLAAHAVAALRRVVPPVDWAVWRFAFGYFHEHRLALGVFGVAAALQSLLGVPTLLLVRMAFDEAIPRHRIGMLVLIGAALVGLRAGRSLLSLLLRSHGVRIVRDAGMRLRRDLLANLFDLSDAYLFDADRDQLHTRIIVDTERVDAVADMLLSRALPGAITVVVLAAVLLYLDATLVVVAALVLPLAVVAGRWTTARIKADVRRFHASYEAFSHGVRFVLEHGSLVRHRAAEAAELERQTMRVDRLRADGLKMALSFARHNQVQSNVVGLAGVVVLVVGGAAIIDGRLSLGAFLAFYVAAGMLNGTMTQMDGVVPSIISAGQSLSKLMAMHAIPDRTPYDGSRVIDWQGTLSAEGVDFAYAGRPPLLRAVSLTLQPGDAVAIIGANGSGKTSLLRLLLGLARPQAGRVTADGVPLAELDLHCIRRRVGVVPQHPGFFAGTVLDNLSYGAPEADEAAIAHAVTMACADGLIARLPQGLHTPIGEGGATLSGGERQLLAIARALVGRPRLLILDEPTNHLDGAMIAQLMASLAGNSEPLGIVLISHDQAVVARARRVLRLEGGTLRTMEPAPDAPVDVPWRLATAAT
jgi:ABC-type bacteriocin/lantibiotic exporter with double-glycine peptidase domain